MIQMIQSTYHKHQTMIYQDEWNTIKRWYRISGNSGKRNTTSAQGQHSSLRNKHFSEAVGKISYVFHKAHLYFIAGKLRSFICQSQGHAKSNESQHKHKTQAEDLMTNFEDTDNNGDQTNEHCC